MRTLSVLIGLSFLTLGSAQSLSDSLLLYYPLDGNAQDASGNGFHGVMNGPSAAPDRFGTPGAACYFNGISEFLEFPNTAALKPDLPVSFSFWIKYDGVAGTERVVFNTSFHNDHNYGVFFNSQSSTGKYAVGYGDGSSGFSSGTRRSFVSNSVIDTSTWHHVAVVVRSASDMSVYVDCNDLGGDYSGFGGPLQYSTFAGVLGKHDQDASGPSNFFKGYLDEFRYWNRGLTLSDVDSLCRNKLVGVEEPLNFQNSFSVYPNPATGQVYLSGDLNKVSSVTIVDLLGKEVLASPAKNTVPLKGISSGAYVLRIHGRSGELLSVHPIVVEQ